MTDYDYVRAAAGRRALHEFLDHYDDIGGELSVNCVDVEVYDDMLEQIASKLTEQEGGYLKAVVQGRRRLDDQNTKLTTSLQEAVRKFHKADDAAAKAERKALWLEEQVIIAGEAHREPRWQIVTSLQSRAWGVAFKSSLKGCKAWIRQNTGQPFAGSYRYRLERIPK